MYCAIEEEINVTKERSTEMRKFTYLIYLLQKFRSSKKCCVMWRDAPLGPLRAFALAKPRNAREQPRFVSLVPNFCDWLKFFVD